MNFLTIRRLFTFLYVSILIFGDDGNRNWISPRDVVFNSKIQIVKWCILQRYILYNQVLINVQGVRERTVIIWAGTQTGKQIHNADLKLGCFLNNVTWINGQNLDNLLNLATLLLKLIGKSWIILTTWQCCISVTMSLISILTYQFEYSTEYFIFWIKLQ